MWICTERRLVSVCILNLGVNKIKLTFVHSRETLNFLTRLSFPSMLYFSLFTCCIHSFMQPRRTPTVHCSVELVEGTQALDLHGSTCSDETVAEAASMDAALTDTDMSLPVISY